MQYDRAQSVLEPVAALGRADLNPLLRSLLSIGAQLHRSDGRQRMLDTILYEARSTANAEAGSFYLAQGGRLRFAAVQNDQVGHARVASQLLGKEIPISADSLAGYVAMTGQIMHVPDGDNVPSDVPFQIHREFDSLTGYRVKSLLAIPLTCPDGLPVGVLELFNCTLDNASSSGFPKDVVISLGAIRDMAAIALSNVLLQEQLCESRLDTIFRLAVVAEYRDADTNEHVQRVSRTSSVLAEAMGIDRRQAEFIRCASPMHDVGKVAIPDAILLKPGHLTADERNVMETHTTIGAKILDGAKDPVMDLAGKIALSHHERWDGQGYPRQVKGDAIPLAARIVGLADVFDAIVSRRCYKDACSLEMALAVIRQDRAKHFDPAVVDAFFGSLDKILQNYPEIAA